MPELKLFVYGTLMPGYSAGELIPTSLVKENRPAKIKGFGMFTNGTFPIVILEKDGFKNKEDIIGRFLRLEGTEDNLSIVMGNLDRYEGVSTGLFRRSKEPIYLAQSAETAWVYSITESKFEDVKQLQKVPKNSWALYRN